ncbi:MAG: tetratricopeptide repeat protein [Fidelibacterota bacterium]
MNAHGNEIDRIIGYRPVDEFLEEIKRINNNRGTIENLTDQLKANPKNNSLLLKLAEKWDQRGSHQQSLKYWELLLHENDNRNDLAQVRIAQNRTKIENTPEFLLELIDNYPDNKYLPDAYRSLQNYYRSEHDTIAEAKTYEKLVTILLETDKVSAGDLNGYAWRMTQLELNLDDALEKIRQAVVLIADEDEETQAQTMDTEAEVLWKLGRPTEAIAIMNQCILLQPEDDYYKEQKEKFETSL